MSKRSPKAVPEIIYPVAFFALCGLIATKIWRFVPKSMDLHEWVNKMVVLLVFLALFAPAAVIYGMQRYLKKKGVVTYTRWYHRFLLDIDYDILLLFIAAISGIVAFGIAMTLFQRLGL